MNQNSIISVYWLNSISYFKILEIEIEIPQSNQNKTLSFSKITTSTKISIEKYFSTPNISISNPIGLKIQKDFVNQEMGGVSEIVNKISSLIESTADHLQLFAKKNVIPSKGIIISGIPGTGKTKLIHLIAKHSGLPYYYFSAPEIFQNNQGTAEEHLKKVFQLEESNTTAPLSLLIIDEIDILAQHFDQENPIEEKLTNLLATLIDSLFVLASKVFFFFPFFFLKRKTQNQSF